MIENIYNKAIEQLTSQGKFHINLGLERVSAALSTLGNPQNSLKFIHIAGTNGKGSTASIIASILKSAGLKVGIFLSPHVFDYTERIQINGAKISKEIFATKVLNTCKMPYELTAFEVLTIVALEYFAQEKVDVVVLETGLGGRLDATNVIPKPLCAIITNIDFDHKERLGDTIEKIAHEKAGIIKGNCPVVIGASNKGLPYIMGNLHAVKPVFDKNLTLKGKFQEENLALALKAVELTFPQPETIIEQGLRAVDYPCRFQYIKEKNLIIDSAHNPDGARALRESLDKSFPTHKRTFIFGCLKHKEYQKMTKILFREDDEVYFYHFDNPNSATVEELQQVCPKGKPFNNATVHGTISGLTVVCGSIYMLKEILRQIDKI